MANFEIVQWPDMDFYRDGIPNREPHLSIKLDGEPLGHKEFFESSDKPNVVYCFHYICDHEDNGKKYKCLHAGALDRETRIQKRSWGSDVIRHFDLRDASVALKRVSGFKERDPQAEAAERGQRHVERGEQLAHAGEHAQFPAAHRVQRIEH